MRDDGGEGESPICTSGGLGPVGHAGRTRQHHKYGNLNHSQVAVAEANRAGRAVRRMLHANFDRVGDGLVFDRASLTVQRVRESRYSVNVKGTDARSRATMADKTGSSQVITRVKTKMEAAAIDSRTARLPANQRRRTLARVIESGVPTSGAPVIPTPWSVN
jgi:hypothetical protein